MTNDNEVLWPTPNWWKRLALQRFAELPHGSRKTAATAIGTSKDTITYMLRGRCRYSKYALSLSDWLGIQPPVPRAYRAAFDLEDMHLGDV